MEINSNLLAPCGLYCGVCSVYYATRDENDPFLEKLLGFYQSKMPGLESLTIEDLRCKGCLSDRTSFFCKACAVKDCTQKQGYAGCHECDTFPCEHIDNFPVAVGKKVIMRAVPYRRVHGTEKWIQDETERYICPACGHVLFRGAKRCNKCKAEVDLD